jgi:hypothetical protein
MIVAMADAVLMSMVIVFVVVAYVLFEFLGPW